MHISYLYIYIEASCSFVPFREGDNLSDNLQIDLDNHLWESVPKSMDDLKYDRKMRLSRLMFLMFATFVSSFNIKHRTHFGKGRVFRSLIQFVISRLNRQKITSDYENILRLDRYNYLDDLEPDEHYMKLNSDIIQPVFEKGDFPHPLSYPSIENDELTLCHHFVTVLGMRDLSELFRLFIVFALYESDHFKRFFHFDEPYSFEYYLRKLKPYLLDPKRIHIVSLVDHVPDDNERDKVAA